MAIEDWDDFQYYMERGAWCISKTGRVPDQIFTLWHKKERVDDYFDIEEAIQVAEKMMLNTTSDKRATP